MSETKIACSRCGAEILAATAKRTGGICMPCKNGAPPEWMRRQAWAKRGADPLARIPWHQSPWRDEIVAICQKVLSGEMGPTEGSRALAHLSTIVLDAAHGDKWLHDDWAAFFQADHLATDTSESIRAAVRKLVDQAK
jgi:hypothetical protein